MVAIESIPGNKAALDRALDFITGMIWKACPDATVERFERNGISSLLAYRGRQRPEKFHIMLNGHVDVVPGKPGQYKAFVSDGNLYGRGVYDMKAACVVLTSVFCEFVDRVPYPLGLQIVTDEESAGQHGTLYQVEQGVRADFVICGECGRPTNRYEIANESKGIAIAELAFRGRSAHSAYPWKGDNAILKAAHFIHALHECYPTPNTPSSETTASVTAIAGDSGAHSKLPDYTTIRVVARYTAGDTHFTTKQHFADFIRSLEPEVEILSLPDFALPIYSNPTNPLLSGLKSAAETVEGAPFEFVRRHGTGDGRFYGAVGNEACEFGIAGEHSHGDTEYIPLSAFRDYLATMRRFFRNTLPENRAESVLDIGEGFASH